MFLKVFFATCSMVILSCCLTYFGQNPLKLKLKVMFWANLNGSAMNADVYWFAAGVWLFRDFGLQFCLSLPYNDVI